jgi:membrane-associated phospholipid phosphatase
LGELLRAGQENAVNKNSQRKVLSAVIGLAVLALVISIFAYFNSRFPGDLEITLLFQSIHSTTLLTAMESISYVSGFWRAAVIVIIFAFVVWRCLGSLESGMVLLAGFINLINEAIKIVINRPRPTPDSVIVYLVEPEKSFPSGHAIFAVLVLGLLTYLAVTHLNKPYLRMLALSVCSLLVLWIGASRIYLGVHWTSDVVGGYIVGGLFLLALIWFYRTLKSRLVHGSI